MNLLFKIFIAPFHLRSFGGGGGGTTTTEKQMPEFLRPAQEALTLGSIKDVYNQTYEPFQGMTTAPMNQAQQAALGMAQGRAISGSPLTDAAGGYVLDALSGEYQNPWEGESTNVENNQYMGNQYINEVADNMVNRAARGYATGTAANTDAQAAMAGAFGGSGHQAQVASNAGAFADAMGSQLSNLYQNDLYNLRSTRQQDIGLRAGMSNSDLARNAGLYGQQQGQMEQAAMMAQGLANEDWSNINHLWETGNQQNAYAQALLDAQRQEFDARQNYRNNQNVMALQFLNAGAGNTGTIGQYGGAAQNQQLMQALAGAGVGYALGGGGL